MGKFGDLRFDTVETRREQRTLADFLRSNVGTYDREQHERWIEEVCIPGIESGERTALAWYQGRQMVGDAVLKVIGTDVAEVKNFRVLDLVTESGRRIAHAGDFMMMQARVSAVDLLDDAGMVKSDAITLKLDTTESNPVILFFKKYGFEEIGRAELYIPGQNEILMQATVPVAIA